MSTSALDSSALVWLGVGDLAEGGVQQCAAMNGSTLTKFCRGGLFVFQFGKDFVWNVEIGRNRLNVIVVIK